MGILALPTQKIRGLALVVELCHEVTFYGTFTSTFVIPGVQLC